MNMSKKILLGSFISLIILFFLSPIYKVEAIDYPNRFDAIGEGGSTATVYTRNDGTGVSTVFELAIDPYLLESNNFFGSPYTHIKLYFNDGGDGSIPQQTIIIDEKSFTLVDGYYRYTGAYDLPEGLYDVSIVRATSEEARGDHIGLDSNQITVDARNAYENLDPDTETPEGPGTPGPDDDPYYTTPPGDDGGSNTPTTNAETTVAKVVTNIYLFVLPIAVVIAVIKILIAIIGLATSSGDPQKLNQAKEEILASLFGLLVIGGAVTLIRMIGSLIGV